MKQPFSFHYFLNEISKIASDVDEEQVHGEIVEMCYELVSERKSSSPVHLLVITSDNDWINFQNFHQTWIN